MNMNSVHLNITIPKELAQALDEISSPGKRSSIIVEAIQKHIEQKQREELEKELEEGYRAAAKESSFLSKEFEDADLEGWDDY